VAAHGAQTRWAFARDEDGNPVAATSLRARSWCVVGAVIVEAVPSPSPLELAAGGALPPALRELERRPRAVQADAIRLRALALLDEGAVAVAPRLSAAAWRNNTAPRAEVLAMFDRAIGRAEVGAA
jgi:hypothetical protein